MPEVGSAHLTIIPKFDGLSATINKALAGADTSSGGKTMGQKTASGFAVGLSSSTGGLAKAGAVFGSFSALAGKAMDVVSDHIGSAISRLDTLENYPQVMQSLGVGADEANSSIQTMSDRLSNLPTRLDTMASTVQGLYAATKDYGVSLTTATDAGLALNDMLLAGGQGTAVVNAAAEQFRQMLAKGKPDMQDWRALLSAAPGQMDQLAKSMLGASATASDLYYALGGGKDSDAHMDGLEFASVSTQQLLDSIIRLDKEGGAGLASFSKQAEQASGGIQTALDNAGNAVTKGLANVMDSIGRENIVSVIDTAKDGISEAFSGIADVVAQAAPTLTSAAADVVGGLSDAFGAALPIISSVGSAVLPVISGIASAFSDMAPVIGPAVAGLMGLKAVVGVFDAVRGAASAFSGAITGIPEKLLGIAQAFDGIGLTGLSDKFLGASASAEALVTSLGATLPVAAGVGGAALAVVGGVMVDLIGKDIQARQRQEEFNTALSDVGAAVDEATRLDDYTARVETVGSGIQHTTEHLDNLTETLRSNAETIQQNNEQAEKTIGTWQTVQSIIDDSIGKSDLTTEQQGRLTWALGELNEATGEQIDAEDVLNGKFQDQAGIIQDLRGYVDGLAQSKIEEARMNALQGDLETAYSGQRDAAAAMSEAYQQYNDVLDEHTRKLQENNGWDYETARASAMVDEEVRNAKTDLDNATEAYNNQTKAVSDLEGEMGGLADATDDAADAYSQLASNSLVSGAFGSSVSDFTSALRDGQVDIDKFNDALEENPQLAAQVARSFDGTRASVLEAMSDIPELSGSIGEAGQKIIQTANDIKGVIDNLGVSQTLSDMGTSADALANKLTDAGVSAEEFGRITPGVFSGLAMAVSDAGGSVDDLASQLEVVAGIDVGDKHFNVVGDGLVECDGLVLDLNSQTIGDKHFTVNDDGTIQLETGEVINLDEQTIDGKHFEITDDGTGQTALYTVEQVDGQTIRNKVFDITARDHASGTLSSIQRAIAAINSKSVTITTTYRTIYQGGSGQTGGSSAVRIRGSQIPAYGARGGIYLTRNHADGFVARQPTVIREGPRYRDVVGENGAEAVIPLTNRHYSQPFADLIAERVARRSEKQAAPTYVINLDGITVTAMTPDELSRQLTYLINTRWAPEAMT